MNNLQNDDKVDDLIKQNLGGIVPPEVEARLQEQLGQFRARLEARRPSWWEKMAGAFQPINQRPMLRIATLACALLLGVGAIWTLKKSAPDGGQLYADTVQQFRNAQTLSYSMVLNAQPYTAVDFTWQSPGIERINCSWGIELRINHVKQQKIILLHYLKQYQIESGSQVGSTEEVPSLYQDLKSLPQQAEQSLGEKVVEGRRLLGFRAHQLDGADPKEQHLLDVWIDPQNGAPDHVDITILQGGKPVHQMFITQIRLDTNSAPIQFDLNPPEGYRPLSTGEKMPGGSMVASPTLPIEIHARIQEKDECTAVVLLMVGSYLQHEAALAKVEAYLKARSIEPSGPPFGRYFNDASQTPEGQLAWEVGYPVSMPISIDSPFTLRRLPKMVVAAAIVTGPHGEKSLQRWAAFIKSIVEQGYFPSGPAMEIWSGGAGQAPETEMRIPVMKTP